MKYQLQQYTVLEKNSQYSRYLAKSLAQLLIARCDTLQATVYN